MRVNIALMAVIGILVLLFMPGVIGVDATNIILLIIFGLVLGVMFVYILVVARHAYIDKWVTGILKHDLREAEADMVGSVNPRDPDILLPGFEYCAVYWGRAVATTKDYFSVEGHRVVTDRKLKPEGEGWIGIRYTPTRNIDERDRHHGEYVLFYRDTRLMGEKPGTA